MSATITWGISQLERETADGYVYTIHYTIEATDGTYRAGAYGSQGLERPDSLIPYADLTLELCVEWLKDSIGAEKVAEIEAALQKQIDEQRQPTRASGLPWAA